MATTTGDNIDGSFGELDFSALPYSSRATASYNSANGVLTVTSNQNFESLTLTNPGPASYAVGSDGSGGTTVAGAGGGVVVISNTPSGPSISSPTDTIEKISISNARLTSSSGAEGTFSGSAVLDYTKGTSQGAFSFSYGGKTESFSNPNVYTENDGTEFVYGLADGSMDDFDIFFNGPSFSSAPSISVATGVTGPGASGVGTFYAGQPSITQTPVCFCAGTLIRVLRGDTEANAAVEELAIGDLVVTASGEHRPIRWLGRRSYSGRFANCNPDVLPICFTAGSLADNVPARDLWVSPKHAMFLDGMLVPAEHLVNGTSVVKAIRVERVDYHHIELDSHDVLLADGAASESFVDDGGRHIFHNAHEHAARYPDAVRVNAVYCALRVEHGHQLEAIRRRIIKRARTFEKTASSAA